MSAVVLQMLPGSTSHKKLLQTIERTLGQLSDDEMHALRKMVDRENMYRRENHPGYRRSVQPTQTAQLTPEQIGRLPDDELVTQRQAAAWLGVGYEVIKGWHRSGHMDVKPAQTRDRQYRMGDLRDWVESELPKARDRQNRRDRGWMSKPQYKRSLDKCLLAAPWYVTNRP